MKKIIFDIQTGLTTEEDLSEAEIREREQAAVEWEREQAQPPSPSLETRLKKLETDLETVADKLAAVEAKLTKQKQTE